MPTPKKINVSQCNCISLRRASNTITEIYDEAMKNIGVTVNQYSILINLSRLQVANTSELAEAINLERSTLVRTIKPLTVMGLIEDISKAGSRNNQFVVSQKGQEMIEIARPIWQKTQTSIDEYLGSDNAELLRTLLHKIIEI